MPRKQRAGKYDDVICSVDGCKLDAEIGGMCDSHYRKMWTKKRNKELLRDKVLCKVPDCGTVIKAHHSGYCTKHYRRMRRHGTLDRLIGKKRPCSVDGCDKLGYGKDDALCSKHRHNFDRYGNPNVTFRMINSIQCEVPGCERFTYRKFKNQFGEFINGTYCKRHRSILSAYDFGGLHFIDYFGQPPYFCALCGDLLDTHNPDGVHIDHDMPRSRGGSDSKDNLQLLCKMCNTSKMALTTDEFIALCEKILNYRRK